MLPKYGRDSTYPDKKTKPNKYDNQPRDESGPTSGILSRTEEAFFLRCFTEIILFEKDLEVQKINLSLREDFNLIDAFGMLDQGGKGYLNPTELHVALRDLDVPITQEDCYLLFLRFNRDMDGVLKYSEFTDAFMPIDQHYARQLGSKRLQYSQPPSRNSFCLDTLRHYTSVWHQMARTEQAVE